MAGKSCFTLAAIVLTALFSNGQSSNDLSARYAAVSAYQVRPGILMTAKYAEDGQAYEMVLQRVYTPDQTDAIR
jgi:hypothetical protein